MTKNLIFISFFSKDLPLNHDSSPIFEKIPPPSSASTFYTPPHQPYPFYPTDQPPQLTTQNRITPRPNLSYIPYHLYNPTPPIRHSLSNTP